METSSAVARADTTPDEVEAATLIEAFHRTVAAHGDRTAIRQGEQTWTWAQLRARVDALAGGLVKLGLRRGDTLALLTGNAFEFHLCDLAAMTVGATPFSLYVTASPEQIEYVVGDAGAKIAIVQAPLGPAFVAARPNLPALEHLIAFGGPVEGALGLDEVTGEPDPAFDAGAAAAAVTPDDLLTLIYTSGTTGPPKGVELTHRNLMAAVEGMKSLIPLEAGSRVISWLPNAHVAERCAHHYLPMALAAEIHVCPDPRQIVAFLPEVHPNWFFAVPRIWEKLKAGLEAKLGSAPEEQRGQVQQALQAATQKVRLEQAGQPVPGDLAKAVQMADEKMFSGLRAALGLDQLEACNVGAAPTPPEVLEFFHAIGIPIAELWGMSETCGFGTTNPPRGRIKIGTVGPPAPGAEIRLADDGEVLIRGAFCMRGYRNLPDKTAETVDAEGWLHTGDIGALDEDGYLKIVDRKKELIINAAGKNMSPANIEATVKASSPLIGQCAVIGDARPFNSALIVLDADYAPIWAAQQGLGEGRSLEELAGLDAVRAAVQEGVDAANARLSRVEQVKKFHIVEGDWQPGGDELTPTMKLKRKPIDAKYAAEIEALYAR